MDTVGDGALVALVATNGGVVVTGVKAVGLGRPALVAVTVSTDTMVLTPYSDDEADASLAKAELVSPFGM